MRISKKKQTYTITHHIRVKQQHLKVNKHHCVSPLYFGMLTQLNIVHHGILYFMTVVRTDNTIKA